MLTEKEKEMLNTSPANRSSELLGEFDIQDALDLISLNEIVNIIIDAYSLGYTRGKK